MARQPVIYSATDANRHFSKLLKRVEAGETIFITSRARVIAEMRPGDQDEQRQAQERASRQSAVVGLLERVRAQPVLNAGRFNRDELYD